MYMAQVPRSVVYDTYPTEGCSKCLSADHANADKQVYDDRQAAVKLRLYGKKRQSSN